MQTITIQEAINTETVDRYVDEIAQLREEADVESLK